MNTQLAVEWHGMPIEEYESCKNSVPPQPEVEEIQCCSCEDTSYARVHFAGNYGELADQFQAFDRDYIDSAEASEIAWAAFGACAHTVTFYDAYGNVLGSL